MKNLYAFVNFHPFEDAADRRVLDLGYALHLFDLRPDDTALEVEERWQIADVQVEILVDRGRQHGTAMLAKPRRIVGAASEEGDAERRARDDHLLDQRTRAQEGPH